MSHPWLFSHALSSMSTSSSSPTYPPHNEEHPVSTSRTSPSSFGWQVAPSRIHSGVRNLVKGFSWKNGRRRTITEGKAGVSVRLWATIRFPRDIVTIRARLRGDLHQGFGVRLHQVPWCRYPFFLTGARVLFSLFVNHSRCMHDHPNTACRLTQKNHSGVKICRVAAHRAQQLPQVLRKKELATVPKISGIIDPHQWNDVQENFGEEDHRAPVTEEVEENGEIRTAWFVP